MEGRSISMKVGVSPNGDAVDLVITANVVLRFRSDRRWIDLKHFSFVSSLSDREPLDRLIAHRQFKDGYIGGGPGVHPIHGPYELSAITPERYELAGADDALAWLEDFCTMVDRPPLGRLRDDIDAVVRRVLTGATAIFRLPVLEGAQHDIGWILDEFRELIAVSRESSEVSLIVMGID